MMGKELFLDLCMVLLFRIFMGVVTLEGVQKLNFRYFIAYYLHVDSENEEMIIRKWETHLHSRCVLPAIEATKNGICRARVNDIFGFHGE